MNKVFELKDLPSDFFCCFCHQLLQKPLTCSECLSANFCCKCGEEARERSSKCPQCSIVWTDASFKSNPVLIKLYENTEIKCPNKDCVWSGSIVSYFEHSALCIKKTIECPLKRFGCDWQDNLKNLDAHKQVCLFYKLQPYFVTLEHRFLKLEQDKDEQITSLRKEMNKLTNIVDSLMKKQEIKPLREIDDVPFSGVMHHISFSFLTSKGFKIGFCEPYSFENSFEQLLKYQKKKYVLLGGRIKNDDFLALSAIGKGEIVLQETTHKKVANFHNGVYWYFYKGKSVGFSESSNVLVDHADWVEISEKRTLENSKLSWHLDGKGGWRLGDRIDLDHSSEYEKIMLYMD